MLIKVNDLKYISLLKSRSSTVDNQPTIKNKNMLSNALKGKRILDFSLLLPGPLATDLLAKMGAEVIKIEHPSKLDETRHYPPFKNGEALLYTMLNATKKSIIIDYRSKEHRPQILQMVREADILVEQFRPEVMQRWGLAYEDLKKVNPNLIYISLTGYGQKGPYALKAGHDLNYLACTGVLDLIRDERGKPVIPGVQIADVAGGSYMLVTACLAALVEGKGQYIDIAMLDGVAPLLTFPYAQLLGGVNPQEIRLLNGGLVNYNVYPCKGGQWVALGALEVRFWNRFCLAVEKPDWQREHFGELSTSVFAYDLVEALFLTKTREEWADWAAEKDVCLSPVLTLEEVPKDAQIKARAYYNTPDSIQLPWL